MSRNAALTFGLILACGSLVVLLTARFRRDSDPRGVPAELLAGSEAGVVLASAPRAEDEERTVISSRAFEPAIDATPAGLRIRSAAGLALAWVEIEIEPGRWQRRDLVQGACDPGATRPPWNVRAPGHVSAVAQQGGDELVLEADALLEIEAPGLRSCYSWFGAYAELGRGLVIFSPQWRDEFWSRVTLGFTSEDRWAIAVNGSGLGDWTGRPREVSVTFKDRTHRFMSIWFDADPGARARWSPTCPAEIETVPLDVAILRPATAPRGALDWILRMQRDVEGRTHIPRPWGRVELQQGLAYWAQGRLGAEEQHLRVDGVPRGEEAELTLHDPVSGAHGQVRFLNEGKPLRVELRSGFTLRGRIAVTAGGSLPKTARLRFGQRRELPGQVDVLELSATDLPAVALSPEGAFEVRGPANGFMTGWIQHPAPDVLMIEVEVPGFELNRSTWPLGEATRVDCGTLTLFPSVAGIVLAPGHGLREPHTLNHLTGSGSKHTWPISRGREEPDGAMTLLFDDDRVEFVSLQGIATSDIGALTVDCSGPVTRSFLHGADGRFARVEEADYEVKVVLDPPLAPNHRAHLAWTWRGISHSIRGLQADDPDERRLLRFRAPRERLQLSWSIWTGLDDEDRSGTVPLNTTSATMKLP